MNAEQTKKMLKGKKTRDVLIMLAVFIVCLAIAIVGFIVGEKNEKLMPIGIAGIGLSVIAFIVLLLGLIFVKIRVKELDGIGLGSYSGFVSRFYVDGKLAGKGRYANATLPNGKKVFCAINAWTGVVYIGIGESWEKKEQIL